MASASQADFGGSDSRRLLHKNTATKRVDVFLFQKTIRKSVGGKHTKCAQVGGFYRRLDSNRFLLSTVRVRSRRDSRRLLHRKRTSI